MIRVLVLGARGLLGTTLVRHLREQGHQVTSHAREGDADVRGDLEDAACTEAILRRAAPDVLINLAALTDVDECERRPQSAYRANVRTVENIVRWLSTNAPSAHLVQLSTDQVYANEGPNGEDNVALVNYYAFSKYAGELTATRVPATVLRTNFFGPSERSGRLSLSDWIITSLKREEPITVFEDVRFSPLSMASVARMIDLVIVKRPRGVFNLGSREGMSKADFAFTLASVLDLPTALMSRGSSYRRELLATRPKDMRMDSSLFENTMGVVLPSLREELQTMSSAYGNETG